MLCYDKGFEDFDIRYVGELWVMFEFNHKDTCKNFLETDAMDHWIVEKRPWDRNFVPLDRLIWVDVEGLPLRAWSKQAFTNILTKWGNIVHLDDDLGRMFIKKRICILSSFQEIISEVVTISIDGQPFFIRIKEAPGWTPKFAWETSNVSLENSKERGNVFENQDENSQCDKDEGSYDPFGIYETIEKMNEDGSNAKEVNLNVNDGETRAHESKKKYLFMMRGS